MATDSPGTASTPGEPEFRFVTNHGNVLLLIARDQRIRIRDIASMLDITERAAQRIVADLSNAGYINREREGRRNVYSLKTGLPTQRRRSAGIVEPSSAWNEIVRVPATGFELVY